MSRRYVLICFPSPSDFPKFVRCTILVAPIHNETMDHMKKFLMLLFLGVFATAFWACEEKGGGENPEGETSEVAAEGEEGEFKWVTEQFADLKILRYQVPGFEELPLEHKKLLYYLSEAALAGREIIYDQNYRHNLTIKRTLENIYETYSGDKTTENWGQFHTYLKRVWFANGIHHHYSTKKLDPGFSAEYFEELFRNSNQENMPTMEGESPEDLLAKISPVMFDPAIDAKRVNQSGDLIASSANNYYDPDLTEAEVDAFYANMIDKSDKTPISYGLNSKLVKENGEIKEKIWMVGGMYGEALSEVANWLEKAAGVAENDAQKAAYEALVKYYRSGDLKDFDEYNILWVQDTESDIDVINGFIEVYGDAKGFRGAFESVVQITDPEASKRIEAISEEAQWFEDNSPIQDEHKKENVTGISARVINVVMEAGDASPSTPIGINLPNSNWIRANHGSKSVNLANIVGAYEEASKSSGMLKEFAYNEEEIEMSKQYGSISDKLHTDMHEVIGHASGKLNPGIGTPKETLKAYASTLEEARADLVALYYMMDPKLIEIGVMESLDVGKTGYNDYIRNGLMLQLRRLELGEELEEAHMRNRQLVCKWVMEKGAADKVIEQVKKDDKTYFLINDYEKLQTLFGDLLREIQRIKSEGDYDAGMALVEDYGVKVDEEVHAEVLQRVEALNIAPYSGFINPVLEPVMENGEITDVKISYPDDFTEQHLYYSKKYNFLPAYN